MNHFIENGWTVGGNADVAAKAGNKAHLQKAKATWVTSQCIL